MNDAPHGALARATLIDAARRLAAALCAPPEAGRADAHVRALERAVAAYVASYGAGLPRRALSGMVASRVRAAVSADDVAGHSAAAIARVLDIVRRAVDDAVAD